MNDIERKALELVNEVAGRHRFNLSHCAYNEVCAALCRAIEQHEAFRQEVSDAVQDYCGYVPPDSPSHPITRFIIAKPDPLVEAMAECGVDPFENWADQLRAALAKRGLEIVEKGK